MSTFSEADQWQNVTEYDNIDYVVKQETTASLTGTIQALSGEYVFGDNGAHGYVYENTAGMLKIANVSSTVFAIGTADFNRSGTTLTMTVASVSATYGAANKPLKELADRDYYIKNRLNPYIEKRQSIMYGTIDSNGYPSIIQSSTTQTWLVSTPTIICAIADGFDEFTGATNRLFSITTSTTLEVTDLHEGINYIYAYYSSDAVTVSSTIGPPQYNYINKGYDSGFLRLNADDSAAGATIYSDIYNNDVTFSGSQISETLSELYFDFTDVLSNIMVYNPIGAAKKHGKCWEIQTVFNINNHVTYWGTIFEDTGTISGLVEHTENMDVRVNSDGVSIMLGYGNTPLISGNIIPSQTISATITPGQDYHLTINYDGYVYRMFLDGSLGLSVTSSREYLPYEYLKIGAADDETYLYLDGYIKWLSTTPYVTATTSFTSATLCPTFSYDFFSIPEMKMYSQPANNQEYRLYLGEIEVVDDEIVDAKTYAYNGKFYFAPFYTYAGSDNRYLKEHNIGTEHYLVKAYYKQHLVNEWTEDIRGGVYSSDLYGTIKHPYKNELEIYYDSGNDESSIAIDDDVSGTLSCSSEYSNEAMNKIYIERSF